MTTALIKVHLATQRLVSGMRSDRGDVPGWVLITLMTAALVTGIWAVAGAQLTSMFQSALDGVTGPNQVHH